MNKQPKFDVFEVFYLFIIIYLSEAKMFHLNSKNLPVELYAATALDF